jgi:hypothetical protein
MANWNPGGQTWTPVTPVQFNRPWSAQRAVTADDLPPFAVATPAAAIIDCYNIRFHVMVTREPTNIAVTGLMTGITDYSVKIWFGGGRRQDLDPHVTDCKNSFWVEGNNCDFPSLGAVPFGDWFESHQYRWAMVQVYGTVFVGGAGLIVLTNP